MTGKTVFRCENWYEYVHPTTKLRNRRRCTRPLYHRGRCFCIANGNHVRF